MNGELAIIIIIVLAITALSYFIGRIILTLIRAGSEAIYVAAAPALGLTAMALQLWLYGLINIPWNVVLLLLPWAVAALLLRKKLAKGPRANSLFERIRQAFMQMDWLGKTLAVASVIFGLAYLVALVLEPFVTSDILAMWGYKAQEFFVHQQVFVNSFISSSEGSSRFYHVDYPPLWPLMADAAYTIIGHVNESVFKGIQFVFLISGASALFIYLKSLVKNNSTVAALITFILVAAPQFIPMLLELKYMGYADYVLGIVMLISAIFAARSVGKLGGLDWWLAIALACLSGVIKNEGLAFAAVVVLVLGSLYLIDCLKHGLKNSWRSIVLTVAGIAALCIPIILWTVYKAKQGIVSDFSLKNFTNSNMTLYDRLYTIFQFIWIYVKTNPAYHWQGFALLLASALTLARGSKPTLVVGAIVVLQLGAYVVSFVLSPYDLKFHILSSIDRLLTQVLPIVLLWLGLVIADLTPANHAKIKQRA